MLVGLLFEICIVDASIFATKPSSAFVGGGVGCVCVCWHAFDWGVLVVFFRIVF